MVSSVAFSADGERLVSTDIDFNRGNVGEVKLWDPVSGLELLTLPGARAAAFSRNGDHLAAVAFAVAAVNVLWMVWLRLRPRRQRRGQPEPGDQHADRLRRLRQRQIRKPIFCRQMFAAFFPFLSRNALRSNGAKSSAITAQPLPNSPKQTKPLRI